ncbi:hypothetical protein J8V57_08895 [Xenorhabdus sp. PB61.4]|uniref:hypothetical protein n=1 Tax=Xenorhabdus sp. PB61.4 TaxID=2788940 RepID=UPI001E2CA688|nr:hypothetical protein [Xenorhabdus sp. PB61.4]MCC8366401.1 hypothetical protein [Xenorhabdus sp. PB61.4]
MINNSDREITVNHGKNAEQYAEKKITGKKNTCHDKRQVHKYNQVYRRIVPHSTLCPVRDEKTIAYSSITWTIGTSISSTSSRGL